MRHWTLASKYGRFGIDLVRWVHGGVHTASPRTPGRRTGLTRLPAPFRKRCRTSCREPPGRLDQPAPWSLPPSTYRRGNRSAAARGTETLKPRRAIGRAGALVVVQITTRAPARPMARRGLRVSVPRAAAERFPRR